ncbi:beta-lactamase/transpeptidase-like protein [Mycena capillaripes]|nr:beta-lactamase/transpeptidase-like protein [Mycena capillaripes]
MHLLLQALILAAVPANYATLQRPFVLDVSDDLLSGAVDAGIKSILEDFNSPGGVGVAVVRKNGDGSNWRVETKGYGISKLDGTEVDSDTLFSIGSNSKARRSTIPLCSYTHFIIQTQLFNILATGLLISNESLSPRISWNTKIASFVPEWKLMDPVASAESTIVDVMSHRTGLPRHDIIIAPSEPLDFIRRLRYLKPSTGFRELWQYNNHMYTLLSYFPPLLVGISFEKYVNDFIFEPLGMRSTTYFSGRAEASGKLADGIARDGVNHTEDMFGLGRLRALPYWGPSKGDVGHVMGGAGGIISSANDMAIWLQTLLGEGNHPTRNTTVIPADVIRRVAAGVTVAAPVAPFPELSPMVYGGGQTRGTYRGFEYIEASSPVSSFVGFRSQVTRIPAHNFGVAVLSNDDAFGTEIAEAIKYRIMDEALKLQALDWSSRFKSALVANFDRRVIPTARPTNTSLPSWPFDALAGKYHDPGYGTVELCLVSQHRAATTISNSCRELVDGLNITLPDVLDPEIPTLLTKWPLHKLTHVALTHFENNVFNFTGFESVPTHNSTDKPYWVRTHRDLSSPGALGVDPNLFAEFSWDGTLGIGMRGLWIAGEGVNGPDGDTVKTRAEVWFAKID